MNSSPHISPLTVNGRRFTPDDLRAWQAEQADPTLSENARNTLAFCQQWLGGQRTFVIDTSGSTGTPKPITIQRQQMRTSARLTGEALGLRSGQRMLVPLPTRYIAGRMMLVRGFVLGMAMEVVEPSSDPLAGLAGPFDFTALVPLQLQALLAGPPQRLDALNKMSAILVGGGPVSAALYGALQAVSAPIYHTYGMTETVTHIALRRLNGAGASDAFVPLPGVETSLDERGCLIIRSDVTLGERIVTNDLVDLRADGSFVWLGRIDNIINSGGVKVQVEKVEAAVERLLLNLDIPALTECRFFIGPLPDERLGEAVALIFEGVPLAAAEEALLQEELQKSLTRFEVPRAMRYLPHFAETSTGKIDRPTTLRALS